MILINQSIIHTLIVYVTGRLSMKTLSYVVLLCCPSLFLYVCGGGL